MREFDPNDELETQEQADAYLNWCAENFLRLRSLRPRTYRSAQRAAHWLFVVATAQLHVQEDVPDYESLVDQLAKYTQLARALERQRERCDLDHLIATRASFDCWESVGRYAVNLLTAAKAALGTLILIEVHPLIDLWELAADEEWAMLDLGCYTLSAINEAEELGFEDFAVCRDEDVTAKFTWQRANNLARHVGMGPLSAN